ncbi:MAG: peptidoglycan DD-metalloendopeptidase family protein [Patescibacteria group bacterium]
MKNKKRKFIILTKISPFILAIFLFSTFIIPLNSNAETVYNGGDSAEIKSLSDQIKAKQTKIQELQDQIKEYDGTIKNYQSQSVTLSGQVQYLDARIKKAEAEIELTENQIAENTLQVENTENQIHQTETDIKTQKQYLREFIQEIYKKDHVSELEVMLGHDSLSDFYNELRSLSILQNKMNDGLVEFKNLKTELNQTMTELEAKKASLKNLKDKLEKNKDSLEEQKITKQNLLSQTRNSEYKFQNLLSSVKSEQANINIEIANLEKTIRQKLANMGTQGLESLGDATFMWPVPNRGITAYFHDPSYPFRYIFEHPAVDIRSAQNSPLRAAASGYVGRVQSNGTTSYGYIMIVHADGFSTVYGHITKSYVKEDQFITQGELIGQTGGMPGTPGAGGLSTGPHLHFEIRKNGIPVNPLNYLP